MTSKTRRLSDSFIQALTSGHLATLRVAVAKDSDLDLQIRENYLNVYYKGNSILKLDELANGRYRVNVHRKFMQTLPAPLPQHLVDARSAGDFVAAIPLLKQRIVDLRLSSLETEYEQLIIRANNREPRNAVEYFFIDRQYAVENAMRFDLTGIVWPRERRHRGQEVALCFIEVKFALNQDIQTVDQQLAGYYGWVAEHAREVAAEAETMLRQKLDLGLFDQPKDRLEAMKTLRVSADFKRYQFIVYLVDYNPHSTHLHLDRLAGLAFHDQVRVACGGFAMWQADLTPVKGVAGLAAVDTADNSTLEKSKLRRKVQR